MKNKQNDIIYGHNMERFTTFNDELDQTRFGKGTLRHFISCFIDRKGKIASQSKSQQSGTKSIKRAEQIASELEYVLTANLGIAADSVRILAAKNTLGDGKMSPEPERRIGLFVVVIFRI